MRDNHKTESKSIAKVIAGFQQDIGDNSLRRPAGLLGVSHEALAQWKAGNFAPSVETLIVSEQRVSRALRCIRELRDLVVTEASES